MPDTTSTNVIPFNPRNGVFAGPEAFELGQRMARALAASGMLPTQFTESLPNTLIALDFALRGNFPPMAVLQNLNVIHGRPAWSSQFIVAAINGCGEFTKLRYVMAGDPGTDAWQCHCEANERAPDGTRGDLLVGPAITIAMAKRAGWYGRNGSQWQIIPELMLRWRAASWFGRQFAAHILSGIGSAEEAMDAAPLYTSPAERVLENDESRVLALLHQRVMPAGTGGEDSAAPAPAGDIAGQAASDAAEPAPARPRRGRPPANWQPDAAIAPVAAAIAAQPVAIPAQPAAIAQTAQIAPAGGSPGEPAHRVNPEPREPIGANVAPPLPRTPASGLEPAPHRVRATPEAPVDPARHRAPMGGLSGLEPAPPRRPAAPPPQGTDENDIPF